GYRPRGNERFVRVEASFADGRTAWSQPFWLTPNAPKITFVPTWAGMAVVGQTTPGARVDISDRGEYLGFTTANNDGQFMFTGRSLWQGAHDFWVVATDPWPDDPVSPPALLNYKPDG